MNLPGLPLEPPADPAGVGARFGEGEVRRYRLTIAYDGSKYHGWQRQQPPDGRPIRTVQGVLEEVLQRLMNQPITLRGASRTDAGVHALGQVAHFDASCRIPVDRMAMAINSRLPGDVEVVAARAAASDFHATADAVSKQYRYRLYNTDRRPLHIRHCVYHCWTPLDVERMNMAASRLVGTHDFAGFAAAGHGRQSTIRTIHACGVRRAGCEVHVVVQGDGFLYNMVRIIAGTLVEVGRGSMPVELVDRVLASGRRREAGPTLPAQGLWLEWVAYRP